MIIMAITNKDTKVVTGKVRLSFVNVFKPTSINGGTEKYSATVMIPKSDKETLKKIKAAVEAAKEYGKSSKWGGKIPVNLDLPLHDGDAEKDLDIYPEFAGHYYLNAKSNTKPGIIDRQKNEILDSTEIYSGCYARADINFYPFDQAGNKGVACGLNNIQKFADGDYLGGRSRAEDVFDAIEDDSDSDDDFLG